MNTRLVGILIDSFPNILINGLTVTLPLTIISFALALVIALITALVQTAKIPVLRQLARFYVWVIRGTPVLVQISLVFFGLPFLGIHFPSFQIMGVDFERLSAGVLALIINSGAYECEIVRSGIQSIPKGQLEGAMSLGFSKWESMVRIIIPQAIRNILPVIGNEFVTLIKESSQVSVIGMADLMYTATTIQGISFQPFPPLVIVALYYFIMTFFVSMCLRVLERHLKVKSVR